MCQVKTGVGSKQEETINSAKSETGVTHK